jgi:hypothetical protein
MFDLYDFTHCNFVLGHSCHINQGIPVHSSYLESSCLSHFWPEPAEEM